MSSEMNFDEFRNFQERERLKKKEIDDNEAAEKKARQLKARKAKAAKDGITGEETPQKSKAGSIGEFLELPQMQTFVVVLLVLDTFSALAQTLLSLQISQSERDGTEAQMKL